MNVGDPVALACAPDWTGVIEKVRGDLYDVVLDNGGKAKGMSKDDLHDKSEATDTDKDRDNRADSDKSWPPKSMETKVPKATGTK